MENKSLQFSSILKLIEDGKLSELEAERLLNAYTRTLTNIPTSKDVK